ncbi:sigma-54 interaction domain-containing protein [Sandaracinobacteroides hominis]|uniref:sigma-54 interaction domain-containing protein n=1 Tax=Sandaracinobacteroides hominis TaxID=2780086 RepID=UPI0018F36423|nr:sigma-54 dependent transcriptional regulator [Sandaracinobacteroides hominis]
MGEVPLLPPRPSPRHGGRVSADLVGNSPAMRELRQSIARVAVTEATVLISGPSGSGKENAARAVHAASPRASGPFEAVNCGAIPHELAEAELFGAEAGAYTGAQKQRIGRLEAAQGGTLFLDEIGDLPLPLQVKLLRALETRSIERLGGGRPIAVDFRLVAATNVDLEAAVAQGRFRADLYWRLAVVWLDLPPLAARREDIPALVAHFSDALRQRLHLPDCGREALIAHGWPGNLRELRNLVERALAHGERVLDAETIARLLHPRRRPMQDWLAAAPPAPPPAREFPMQMAAPISPMDLKALMAEAEAALIAEALAASGGTIAQSARLLGMKRTTLVEKMKRMGLKAANEAA